MACNFLGGDRDQPFLLPPDLRDWLPQEHLAWFICDVVDQLNLAPFYRAHRDDGHGHPAYDPKLLLGVPDASVLAPRVARSILLRLADAGFLEIRWTSQIIQETHQMILAKPGSTESEFLAGWSVAERAGRGLIVR